MYCGNCGKEIKEGSAFCPACGAKVVIVKTGRENSKKKNRKKIFIPVLLIIIIAIIGIKNVSNIKPVVEKFLTKNNVQKDDMDDDEQAGWNDTTYEETGATDITEEKMEETEIQDETIDLKGRNYIVGIEDREVINSDSYYNGYCKVWNLS
mgnify:CR=1 FL=1